MALVYRRFKSYINFGPPSVPEGERGALVVEVEDGVCVEAEILPVLPQPLRKLALTVLCRYCGY